MKDKQKSVIEEQEHSVNISEIFDDPKAWHNYLSELARIAEEINKTAKSNNILVSNPSQSNKKFAS